MADKKCEEKKICDISQLMETFGKYQIIQFVLICLPTVFVTMVNINYIFVAGDINYRCRINQCEDNSTSFYPSWWPNTTIDRCMSPVLHADVGQVCTNTSFTGQLEKCTEWVYESDNTVVAALDLACQPWKTNMIGTIHSTGMLVTILLSGWMSDRFGRKPTFIFCMVGGSIGHLKTIATTYYVYAIIEFLEAAVTGGTYAAAMVILLEIASTKHRLLSGVIFAYAMYFGECMFAVIAMFVPYWKTIIRIMNGPLIFVITYIFFLQESPRWQIVSGNLEKAKRSMKRITRINKININQEELDEMTHAQLKEKFDITEDQIKESYGDIFTSKAILKRLLVCGACRFTSSFVYYGLMVNSVYLPGDKYVNFMLSTIMSFPGELISLYSMNKYGRKLPLIIGYYICGTVTVALVLVPDTYEWAKVALFLLGKVVISACFTGGITYTMELFPTSVRGTLLGLGAFASRVGGMLAPLTPILNEISTALPSIFFGCFAIVTGTLICLTPETKSLPLFDTIKQVEESDRVGVLKKEEKRRKTVDSSMETIKSTV